MENRVVIIGMQCKFPDKSNNPADFFNNICNGKNYCTDTPSDRWNIDKYINEKDSPGKGNVRRGHYINYDFQKFDASAFGFAPKEVEFMDPLQRLLLETVWESFENANINPTSLSGGNTGVYIGGFTVDHLLNQFSGKNRDSIGSHSAAGSTLTMLANRISYAFNLKGPSLSIDTACSSSLISFVMAVQDIQAGRCDMAVTGGANFMLRPEYVIAMSKGNFLSADGRSKSFDARADGYGRGEGCGILLLKNADLAEADGDNILAYVDGAGMNQDGRTGGITVPNPESQQSLMKEVLQKSGVDPASVCYVEAHGTGTPVGDPLEAEAIGNVYGLVDRDDACIIGSVKSNIGHLEAAAGVAAVIKSVCMLENNLIPPIAGLEIPNPNLSLKEKNLKLADKLMPLGKADEVRRIAVNSFGYGGANAHIILRSATKSTQPKPQEYTATDKVKPAMYFVPISARSQAALLGNAANIAKVLETQSAEDIVSSITQYRPHYEQRAVAWGESPQHVAAALAQFGSGKSPVNVASGRALTDVTAKTAFIYTGMGPQWWGMGRGLYQTQPVYRQAVDKADVIFKQISGFSIVEEMNRAESDSRIKETQLAQPGNFVLQYGLTHLLAAQGIKPEAVMGHSVGEVTSAWASGMLSLEDALFVSYHRSRVQATTAGQGGMLAVGIDADAVGSLLRDYAGKVDIAAINAPNAITLAGDAQALASILEQLESQEAFVRKLDVDVPYHSFYMDQLEPELVSVLAKLDPQAPQLNLYSTVTGGQVNHERYNGQYWAQNVRQPVLFMKALQALLDDGYSHFIEVGPHAVLSRSIKDVFKESGSNAQLCSTLSMKVPDEQSFGAAVAGYYVGGGSLDWSCHYNPENSTDRLALPNYAWDREVMWKESDIQINDRLAFGKRGFAQTKGLQGFYSADLNVKQLNFLEDHVVSGVAILPAAAYLETMFEIAEAEFSNHCCWALHGVKIERALVLDREQALHLEVSYDEQNGSAVLSSRPSLATEQSNSHMRATLRPLKNPVQSHIDLDAIKAQMHEQMDIEQTYNDFKSIGLDYLSSFRPIVEMYRDIDSGISMSKLNLPAPLLDEQDKFLAHPSLIDGAFQSALMLIDFTNGAYLPTAITEFRLFGKLPATLWVKVELKFKNDSHLVCDLFLFDTDGNKLADIQELKCSALNPHASHQALPDVDYALQWEQTALAEHHNRSPFLVVSSTHDAFIEHLQIAANDIGSEMLLVSWSDPSLAETIHKVVQKYPERPLLLTLSSGLYDADPVADEACAKILQVLRNMVLLGESSPKISIITRNGFVCDGHSEINPAQAAIANFVRTAHNELEGLHLSVIDLDSDNPQARACLKEVFAGSPAHEVALRQNNIRLVPKLKPTGCFTSTTQTSVCLVKEPEKRIQLSNEGLKQQWCLEPGKTELLIDFDAICLLPDIHSSSTNTSKENKRNNQQMGFCGTIRAVGDSLDTRLTGQSVYGITPQSRFSSTTVELVDLIFTSRPPHTKCHTNAAVAPLYLPVVSMLDRLSVNKVNRAVVATTPHGKILADLLEQRGITVTRVSANPQDWLESALDEQNEAFDLIAAPVVDWSHTFGFSRWLAASGQLVDLDLIDHVQDLVLPPHVGSFSRIVAFCCDMQNIAKNRLESTFVDDLNIDTTAFEDWRGTDPEQAQIITFDRHNTVKAQQNSQPRFNSEATYLVTGGLGALGQKTALWLAKNGAGRIALGGRRGTQSQGADALCQQLAELGAQSCVLTLDTSDADSTYQAVAAADSQDYPLKGVFHAAGILDDRPILELDEQSISAVIRPKAIGALALHQATKAMSLDVFVLYSSIASLIGNKRQANYCAANGFMDALAHLRQSQGLPGLSINFGAIGEIGMAADKKVEAHLRQIGLPPIAPSRALAGVGVAIEKKIPQVVVSVTPDWERYSSYDPIGARTVRLSEHCQPFVSSGENSKLLAVKTELAKVPYKQRLFTLCTLLAEIIAAELKIDSAVLTPSQPLETVGIDSLIAVEIQYIIEASIGINVSAMLLIGNSTLNAIATRILNQIGLAE